MFMPNQLYNLNLVVAEGDLSSPSILFWVGFIIFFFLMLLVDLKVFHKKAHKISLKEGLLLAGFWISLALTFNLGVFLFLGGQKALEFLTGYMIEFSLSMDNLFVFLVIFSYFAVPAEYQHRVLLYGILGALVMRLSFILVGIALIQKFHWVIYLMGALLVYVGVKLALRKDREVHPERNPIIRWARKFFPLTDQYHKEFFFLRQNSRLFATPLFIVLLVVESTDIVFAIDSIPAILAITRDPFIVFTSNAFAILGLRTFYFILNSIMPLFRFLHYGLAVILVYVGIKMLLSEIYKIPTSLSLIVVAAILAVSIFVSLLLPRKLPHLATLSEKSKPYID